MSRTIFCDECGKQISESFPAPEYPSKDFCSEECCNIWEQRWSALPGVENNKRRQRPSTSPQAPATAKGEK